MQVSSPFLGIRSEGFYVEKGVREVKWGWKTKYIVFKSLDKLQESNQCASTLKFLVISTRAIKFILLSLYKFYGHIQKLIVNYHIFNGNVIAK